MSLDIVLLVETLLSSGESLPSYVSSHQEAKETETEAGEALLTTESLSAEDEEEKMAEAKVFNFYNCRFGYRVTP